MSRFKKLKDIESEKNIGELFDIRVIRKQSGLIDEYKNSLFLSYGESKYFFLISNKVESFDTKYSEISKIDIYAKFSVKVH